MKGRLLSSGTFALQCHDPGSKVYFKDIKVKLLSDDLPSLGKPQEDPVFEAKIVQLAASNIPLVDLHAHMKGGLTSEKVLEKAHRDIDSNAG